MKKGTTFQECKHCSKLFLSQFNLHRHLVEQHNNFQEDNNFLIDGSEEDEEYPYTFRLCGIEGKYYRNIYSHVENVHEKKDACFCKICLKEISFSSNLKRHYREFHGIFDFGRELHKEKIYSSNICNNRFKRKSHLASHQKKD
jgi:hypothetical protein